MQMKPKKREHTSITGQPFFGTDAEFYLHNNLPLGRWTCADGREVLFNSFEEPIWQRRPGAEASQADPHARVSRIVMTERIYGPTHRHHEKREIAKKWLEEFRSGSRIPRAPDRREYVGDAAFEVDGGIGGRRWK
jgi:hypothetical protein